MREIKFRVWNKATQTMHFPDWNELAERAVLPEMFLQQFTGLTDRKGKEIYEGDIVKSEQWTPEIYRVWFSRGGFCFSNDTTDIEYVNDAKYLEQFEVIGNIYENPELLK